MNIWAVIKSLDFNQFFFLSKALLSQPNFILPTYKATKQTMKTCDDLFGKAHHRDNKANAFRHVLWSFLIAEKCYQQSRSVEKAIHWTKQITDLHEKLAPNEALPKAMDLHNNSLGRKIFKANSGKDIDIISLLREMMNKAVRVKGVEDLKNEKEQMVYMEKDEAYIKSK